MKSIVIRIFARWNLIVAASIATVISIYINYERIIDPYFMGSIDSHSLYFIYGFADKTILTNDIFVQAFIHDPLVYLSSIPIIKPLFFMTIFLVRVFSLPLSLTMHSVVYQIISAIFVFKIGKTLIDHSSAFILMGIFLIYTSSMDSFYGGMVRGSGFLIISILYYCMIKEYALQTILLIPITFICYPPILPGIIITSFLFTVRSIAIEKKEKFMFFLLVVTIVILAIINFYANQRLIVSMNEFMQQKRFMLNMYSSGKYPVLDLLSNYILNIPDHRSSYVYFIFVLLFSVLTSLLRKEKPLMLLGEKIFIISSFLSFTTLFFMNKELASRQLIFSLPLFLIIYCWKIFIDTFKKHPRLKFIILVVIISIFVIFKKYIVGLESRNRSYYKKVFSCISKLPAQALIAGHPVGASLVPYFTKKSVFFIDVWDTEFFLFSSDYKKIFKKRKHDLLEALYTSEPTVIVSFIEKNKITHFLIEDYYYSRKYFTEDLPFDEKEYQDIANTIRANNKTQLLLSMAHKYGVNFGKGIYILSADIVLKTFLKNRLS